MKKVIQKLFIVAGLAISITGNTYCQVYDYPVKPGSNEWRQLKSHDEMVNVCQIPDSVLSLMSTKDLLENCLFYPLLLDMLAYDNIKTGFETMSKKFKGFQEFMKRSDSGKFLIEKYKRMNFEETLKYSVPSQKGHYSFLFSALELMLANDNVLNNLNESEKKLLLKDAIGKYEFKIKQKEIYGTLGQITVAYLTAKVMKNMGNKEWDLFIKNNIGVNNFTETIEITNPDLMESIILKAKEIMK